MISECQQQHGVSESKATAKQSGKKYEGNTSIILFQWMMNNEEMWKETFSFV